MCYLCEKYAPINGIDKYDPQKDPSATDARLIPAFTKPPQENSGNSACGRDEDGAVPEPEHVYFTECI